MQCVNLRPLRRGDGTFLCSIFKDNPEYYAIFHDPEDRDFAWEERVARFVGQDQVRHYILEAECGPIGWLSCSDPAHGERELDILVLKKDHLCQGYGAAALSWFLEKCKADHISRIFLNVNQSNTRAIQFYMKFGFDVIAEEIIPECNDAQNLAQYKMGLEFL